MLEVVGFIACGAVIFFAGKRLSHYGDLLAEKTGLGKAWIGLILMSAVTSLPELMVGISSTAFVGNADLAVGDILGSCAINLGILSIMDVFTKNHQPILGTVSRSHILAGTLSIILVTIAGFGLYMSNEITIFPSLGITSFLFAVIYFISLRVIYNYNKKEPHEEAPASHPDALTLQQVILRYSLYAAIIIAAALFLPHFAESIALSTGLGATFVGTLFLAVSTSLPEIAVSVAAVRSGSADMAVGNFMGSNIFNIFILFIDDIFYTKGTLLHDASDLHIISVFAVIIMSAIAIIGLTYRSSYKRFWMSADTFMIMIIYIINLILLYRATP